MSGSTLKGGEASIATVIVKQKGEIGENVVIFIAKWLAILIEIVQFTNYQKNLRCGTKNKNEEDTERIRASTSSSNPNLY
ncbi:136_t:CDS:2 [Acaulospora morrowiae]|uniref:136_t:CDS:1 n=1 Tax=Acaulospora morrowiae TaxID=94023 RepID=A0A9N8YRJ1_9GLOM|nr:136_t:CDS:2 [Acaulospora morrowiae]